MHLKVPEFFDFYTSKQTKSYLIRSRFLDVYIVKLSLDWFLLNGSLCVEPTTSFEFKFIE